MAGCDFLVVESYDGMVLVRVMKDRLLDPPVIVSLAAGFDDVANRHPRSSFILDLSDVAYLSSAVLGKIVALIKRVKSEKGRLAVAGVKPALAPLFKVTQIDRLCDMAPDAQQAIMLYRRKPL